MLITILSVFFNIITYLLLNSDYGIGCVYSPLGFVIFVAVEGTFVRFTEGLDHFIIYNFEIALCFAWHYSHRTPYDMVSTL